MVAAPDAVQNAIADALGSRLAPSCRDARSRAPPARCELQVVEHSPRATPSALEPTRSAVVPPGRCSPPV